MNNRVPPNSPPTPNLFGSGLYRPVTPSASPALGGRLDSLATPSLFGSGLFRPVTPSVSPALGAAGWLDQRVPITPKSKMTSLEKVNRQQQCVPQIATPRPGLSPWIPSHIAVVPHTPIKKETNRQDSSQETSSNAAEIEDLFSVVPNMEITGTTMTTSSTSPASSTSSLPPTKKGSSEEAKYPTKRRKRYLV